MWSVREQLLQMLDSVLSNLSLSFSLSLLWYIHHPYHILPAQAVRHISLSRSHPKPPRRIHTQRQPKSASVRCELAPSRWSFLKCDSKCARDRVRLSGQTNTHTQTHQYTHTQTDRHNIPIQIIFASPARSSQNAIFPDSAPRSITHYTAAAAAAKPVGGTRQSSALRCCGYFMAVDENSASL